MGHAAERLSCDGWRRTEAYMAHSAAVAARSRQTFSALFAAPPRGPWPPTSRSGDTCVSRYRRDRQSASLTPSGHGASFSVALFSSYQGMILSLLRASTLLLSGGAM